MHINDFYLKPDCQYEGEAELKTLMPGGASAESKHIISFRTGDDGRFYDFQDGTPWPVDIHDYDILYLKKSGHREHVLTVKQRISNQIDTLSNIDETLDKIGHTILHTVASYGDKELLEKALARNPDINAATTENGFTPMHKAAVFDKADAIILLAEAGASMEIKTKDKGLTPLQLATMRNKQKSVFALISAGADVHAVEGNKATALHGAAFNGNLDIVKILVEAGADPMLPDRHGNTPLSLARDKGAIEVHKYLNDIVLKA